MREHPIFEAVRTEQWEQVKDCLKKEPTCIHTRTIDRKTVLICLIEKTQWDLAMEVVDMPGIDVHAETDSETNALHYACAYGHLPLVQTLLEKGVNIDGENQYRSTPLIFSCWKKNLDIAKYLIQKGADVIVEDNLGDSLFNYIRSGYLKLDPQFILDHAHHLDEETRKKFLALRLEKLFT